VKSPGEFLGHRAGQRSRSNFEESALQNKPEPAPFETGERLEYLGKSSIEAPARHGDKVADTLLKAGMIGTVGYSKPGWTDLASKKAHGAHCMIKFDNGYEVLIDSGNKSRFKKVG
jgi:hypothetical protein